MDKQAEWLEADGLGGFASGTVGGFRTRRYHALLLCASTPPTGRKVLVNGFEAWLERGGKTYPLSTQVYFPGVFHPRAADSLESFSQDPWPHWIYRFEDGTVVDQELFVPRGRSAAVLFFSSDGDVVLHLRPLLSGRDYHALHHENPAFCFDAQESEGSVSWQSYPSIPSVTVRHNGHYRQEPQWYRQFLYEREKERGLDDVEDLGSPGILTWDLSKGPAWMILSASERNGISQPRHIPVDDLEELVRSERQRRSSSTDPLLKAAESYFVKRGKGQSLIAGYPWFTDWGRDSFIALRGLGLATGWLERSREILLSWAGAVSEGMVPNRFPDQGEVPEYNSVDASLWYVVTVGEYLQIMADPQAQRPQNRIFRESVQNILEGYARGTRFGIHLDDDGLLFAGEEDSSITWMDARVDGRAVTPRIGKPVEVQALWLNALQVGCRFSDDWKGFFQKGMDSFTATFWNGKTGCLFDVADAEGKHGAVDESLRPNQIFAVGGLPLTLLPEEKARSVVDGVERELLTPLGLRSLSTKDPLYRGYYEGGPFQRDGSYHQGTAWTWLMGPFVEAWVRVRGGSDGAKQEARRRFLDPLLAQREAFGLGHLPEIADGDAPHTPRGCPFQAWSLGEALRLDRIVLK